MFSAADSVDNAAKKYSGEQKPFDTATVLTVSLIPGFERVAANLRIAGLDAARARKLSWRTAKQLGGVYLGIRMIFSP
jgi:hypothetical protein